ncbi:MAG: DUF3108 domain-containing protein [Spirochaetes bacterium]|nr:DUF3108 domain-containing protein [Spirochaetota bacterium]
MRISILVIFSFIQVFLLSAWEKMEPPFKVGEYLEYKIYALGIPVARQKSKVLKMTNMNNRPTYHIHTDIKTLAAISKIYHLHDKIDCFVDKETLLPVLITTSVNEGKWKNYITLAINQEEREVFYKDKQGILTLEFKDKLVGLVSVLYFLRSMEPEIDETIELSVSKKREIINLEALVVSTNEKMYVKSLSKKAFSCIHYRDEESKKAGIWISKDGNRLPLKIVSVVIPIGDYGVITFENRLKKFKAGK